MKSKLFYKILLLVGLLQACAPEVDDIFDTPAQQRVNEELKSCRELLVSSEYGWVFDYFPSAKQEYGGYCMVLKFTEKEVIASGETANDPSYKETSLYSMKSDMGPTLNFDTYNSIIHYFSDPDKSEGAGVGKGYEGDYEFVIMDFSDNEIILKGKKTKNLMKLIRLDKPSEEYLTGVAAVSNDFTSIIGITGAEGNINGEVVNIGFPSERRISFQIGDGNISEDGYLFTSTGIKLYKPIEIGGKEVTSLEWSHETHSFMYDGKDLSFVYDPEAQNYLKYIGKYTMSYSGLSGKKDIEVEVLPGDYKQNYILKGMLPFDIILIYAEPVVDGNKMPRMELLNQKLQDSSGNYLSVWNSISGKLTYGGTDFQYGMYAKQDEENPDKYAFVDDGRRDEVTNGMILWGSSGEYKAYGESRFSDITLLKHQ